MLERGLLSRILFPAPVPSYSIDSFPHDLIWIPKALAQRATHAGCAHDEKGGGHGKGYVAGSMVAPPIGQDDVPCLMMPYPSARFLILFFHSNAEDLGRCRGFCNYIREQFQVHVLAVEYPGYGICPGVASGAAVMENALAALHFVTDVLRWPIDSIKVFGRSIGTGPASLLASRFRFAGVILVTPFLSIQELFRDRVGPFATLVEEWFDNKSCMPQIMGPTMIIHGQRDALIPCRHGESLYALCKARKLLISPPEMEHNTNLLTNLRFFVLPMFQFFALPDYAFTELHVPRWAYDKRRSPFYVRPFAEVTHAVQAVDAGGSKSANGALPVPAGDEYELPPAYESDGQGLRRHPSCFYAVGDTAPLVDLEQFTVETQPTVNLPLPSATKGKYHFARDDRSEGDSESNLVIDSRVMQRIAALAHEIVSEVCSDGLSSAPEVPTREATQVSNSEGSGARDGEVADTVRAGVPKVGKLTATKGRYFFAAGTSMPEPPLVAVPEVPVRRKPEETESFACGQIEDMLENGSEFHLHPNRVGVSGTSRPRPCSLPRRRPEVGMLHPGEGPNIFGVVQKRHLERLHDLRADQRTSDEAWGNPDAGPLLKEEFWKKLREEENLEDEQNSSPHPERENARTVFVTPWKLCGPCTGAAERELARGPSMPLGRPPPCAVPR